MKRSLLRLLLATALAVPAGLAQAVPADDGNESNDPGRGVARVSLLNGDVSVRRGDSGDWVAAAINAPLMGEDRVATGPDARAEVQFDYYHRIRLAGDSEIRLGQLDERNYQIQVARGTVTFSAIRGGDAQVELSLPGASLRPLAYGSYRITVTQDGSAELTVRSGEADIFSSQGTQRLRTGRTMHVRLTGSGDSEYMYVAAIQRDAWDEFNQRRDSELGRAQQVYQYVPRDVYGAEDLNGNGDWSYVAPYGWCWRPYVADGWAPYRYGRWSWYDYYGWTWVSQDAWGWAPYHYGRWFSHGGRWCWYPGAMGGHRHYWSPALVGWFGWNSWGGFNAGVGFGWGAVGWVPLAPFEPIHRWWGGGFYRGYRGGDYFGHTTIVNNINVTNMYRNARVDRGYTVVNGHDFSRSNTSNALRVSGGDLARANSVRGMLPVSPSSESLRVSDRNVSGNMASRANAGSERFYSRTQSSRMDRVPFEDQRRTMERATTSMARGGGLSPAGGGHATAGVESRSPQTGGANAGWSHFGDPQMGTRGGSSDPGNGFRGSESSRGSAWTGFGDPLRGARGGEGTAGGNVGRQDGSRGSWSTGGGSGASPSRMSEGSTRSRGNEGASEGSTRGGWSTGGGSGDSGQRWSSGRSGGASGGSTGRSDASERWSTGGGSGDSGQRWSSGRSSSPSGGSTGRSDASERSSGGSADSGQRWSSGRSSSPSGGYSGGSMGRSDASERSSGGSAGPGYSSPRSSGGYSGGGSMGGGSYSSPRSSGGGGYSAPRSGGGGSMGGGGGSMGGGAGAGSSRGGGGGSSSGRGGRGR